MVLISGTQKAMSLSVRGQLGFSAGVGMARCGYSRCGADKNFGGIYQKKVTQEGNKTSRMRYYRPSNPQTTTQQNWRAVFSAGVVQWQALTAPQKGAYNVKAKSERLTGFQLFMRSYLLANYY